MPITINGSGTITGISAGGLPDASIVTADIADAAITAAKMSGAQNGSAPIYAARAWVNFNGTGTVAIRASGNVSSITDNGVGYYTVNFTTAMVDSSYAYSVNISPDYVGGFFSASPQINTTNVGKTETAPTSTAFSFVTLDNSFAGYRDIKYVNVVIFR